MISKYIEVAVFIGAFAFALILGALIIPVLKKLKFGQTVREDGPATHLVKSGTPTMGGVIFLLPIVIISVIIYFLLPEFKDILPLAFVTVGFGFIGFLDDYIKIIKKSKDGLTPLQKMLGLILVSAIFSYYIYRFTELGTSIDVKLFKLQWLPNLHFMYVPFIIIVLIAMTNAVNLTDGLDGLAGGVSFIVLIFFAIYNKTSTAYNLVTLYSMIAAGAVLGFLAYNLYPAKVIMGDTGSLALGGLLRFAHIYEDAAFASYSWLDLRAGSTSVIIQVAYYKRTKKRIFKMAPLHHHFEQCGWKETKLSDCFMLLLYYVCISLLL